jgi:hypothetical protein
MPIRIEKRYTTSDHVRITLLQEAYHSFTVGPAEAMDILGTSKTTLFRHEGPDVKRLPSKSARYTIEEPRVYNDQALLRIASELRSVDIQPDGTGLTKLISDTTETVLDIMWGETLAVLTQKK